jgi:rhodanese-related sulfurtransferase
VGTFADPEHELTPKQVAELHAAGEVELIDVREAYERDAGHIANTRHIEIERLASQAETIDRDRTVVFYCRMGARSGMAAQAFRASGYDARNMTGGITSWAEAGLPLEPDDGYVADH